MTLYDIVYQNGEKSLKNTGVTNVLGLWQIVDTDKGMPVPDIFAKYIPLIAVSQAVKINNLKRALAGIGVALQ
jgi:hypothetical protein